MAKYDEMAVIRIIYLIPGKVPPGSATKKVRKKSLTDNLDYTDEHIDSLQMEMDRYVKTIKPEEKVTDAEIGDCDTVGDVLDLIEEKTK